MALSLALLSFIETLESYAWQSVLLRRYASLDGLVCNMNQVSGKKPGHGTIRVDR
jgi:hypothetical protein